MEIKPYFMLARKWLWLVIVGLIIGAIAGVILNKIQDPVYQAKTRILVSRNSSQASTYDFAYLSDQQLVSTYVQLLNGKYIIDATSKELGFKVDAKTIDVNQVLDTQIIEIAVTNSDPELAAKIANKIVAVLLEQSENLQASKYSSAENSLNLQVEQVKKQMDSLRTDYDQSSQKDIQERITVIDLQINKFQQNIDTLQQDIARLNPPKDVDQRVELNVKQAQLEQITPLLSYYQQIRSNLDLLGTPNQTGLTNENPRLSQMQSTLKLYEQLYLSLLNNLESVRLMRLQLSPNIAQIEQASLPEKPTGFSPTIIILLMILGGGFLSVAAAVVLEFLDDSIKSPEDVENLLGLPTLGSIPDIGHQKREKVFFIEKPDSSAADAIRVLRKNIIHAETQKSLKTLLVVSPGEKEGKTDLVVNLATSFVYLGSRVAVVDANVRSPQLHKFLNVNNTVGLGDILSADTAISNAVVPLEEYKAVSAITAGNMPISLTEKLESDRLSYVLSKLNEKAEMVILDGPALFSADTLAFASRADGVLLVLCPGHTKRDAARDAVSHLKKAGVHIIGVALNRIPKNWEKYYSGFHYGTETKTKEHNVLVSFLSNIFKRNRR